MKKWFSIFGIALISVSVLYATPVTVEEVEAVAEKFISEYHGGSVVNKIDRIIPAGENGNIFYYAVILEPSGWLLISADDFVQPVLGYFLTTRPNGENMVTIKRAVISVFDKSGLLELAQVLLKIGVQIQFYQKLSTQ